MPEGIKLVDSWLIVLGFGRATLYLWMITFTYVSILQERCGRVYPWLLWRHILFTWALASACYHFHMYRIKIALSLMSNGNTCPTAFCNFVYFFHFTLTKWPVWLVGPLQGLSDLNLFPSNCSLWQQSAVYFLSDRNILATKLQRICGILQTRACNQSEHAH
jgi:hypothetical protein